jgi:hypothetical protein
MPMPSSWARVSHCVPDSSLWQAPHQIFTSLVLNLQMYKTSRSRPADTQSQAMVSDCVPGHYNLAGPTLLDTSPLACIHACFSSSSCSTCASSSGANSPSDIKH